MRSIEYLSPSSINQWMADKEEFYLRYLADDRPNRQLQTQPMSVGSAFDAYVKSYLHERLYGVGHDPSYSFDALFTAQVEPHNIDFAKEAGKVCFDAYMISGAMADLMLHLNTASDVKFEFKVQGVVEGHREGIKGTVDGIVFLGKPDAYFVTSQGHRVILDWKVSGYCAKYPQSPKKYYVKIRDGWRDTKPSGNANGHHPAAHPMMVKGIVIDVANKFEGVDLEWARQLSVYSWLCGEKVGGDFIVALDQLACSNGKIRVAQFRSQISESFQRNVYDQARNIWTVCKSDHIFRQMTKAESQARCATLDAQAATLRNNPDWFNRLTRGS